jgi:hypothetical protein
LCFLRSSQLGLGGLSVVGVTGQGWVFYVALPDGRGLLLTHGVRLIQHTESISLPSGRT